MKTIDNANYYKIILLHLLLGFIFFQFRFLSFGYSALILILGCFFIIKNKNQNNEVLFWAAYVVGAEVFLRMAKGNIGNEFGKYVVIIFMVLGIYYKGISRKATPYFIFFLLLIPGLLIGIFSLDFDTEIRKAIAFNLSGPVCLAISCLYTFGKPVTLKDFEKLTRWSLYPLTGMLVYILLYNPSIQEVVTGTDSNSATSGGFGPNQVSTMLGIGMFFVFIRFLFFSKGFFSKVFHILFLSLFMYRGLITFSRGGLITGVVMIVVLILVTIPLISIKGKIKLGMTSALMVVFAIGVFIYSITQTSGLILNRYVGQDALGREKSSKFSGREELANLEFNMFIENPIFGVGVGRNKEIKGEVTGHESASHSEVTRMLAEHGVFGVLGLLILLIVPFLNYFNNKQYVFLIPFFLFWLLTINHAAMRIAAPAFIYALSLLNFSFNEKPTVPRE
jgi:O-antigen ligase